MGPNDLLKRIRSGQAFTVEEVTAFASDPSQRTAAIQALLELLGGWTAERSAWPTAVAGITALGELRAEEGLPVLIEHLLLQPFEPEGWTRIRAGEPPAFAALVKIGEPAVKAVLEALEKADTDADAVAVAVAHVLTGVLGAKGGEQLVRERQKACAESSELMRRLEEARQYFSGKR